jgi:signal transduction histidine kinase
MSRQRWVWIAAALLVFAALSAAAAEPRRVLVLQSFGRDFEPFSGFSGRFREELARRSPERIDFYESSLQTARHRGTPDEAPFANYLLALFAERPPDLVVAIGGPAARFFQQYRSRLFASTPLLISGIDQRRVDDVALTPNDTVVGIKLDLPGAIYNILHVLPRTTTVAVVIGNSPVEQVWVEEMRREFQPLADKLNFIWFNDLSLDQMKRHATNLPQNSAVFYALLAVDAEGVPHEQALTELRAVANAPVFGFLDSYFGLGIVGGPLNSTRELSRDATSVALRILRGESPATIKTPPRGPGAPVFDWRELRHWNISEASLPAGSTVLFREPTLWQRYGEWFIAAGAIVLLQSALITVLLVERHRRRAAERESRDRLWQVIHLNRAAAAGALSGSIGHEINQPLGIIRSNTDAAELLLAESPIDVDELKEILADIRQADQRAADIVTHMRGLLKKRVKIDLHDFDLNDAIQGALHVLDSEAAERGVVLSANGVLVPLPVRADLIHLHQVILILTMNAMDAMDRSDSGKREVVVQTALSSSSEVEVSVADTGPGIPADQLKAVFDTFYTTKAHGTGLGLSIARMIVETYGGRIWAENRNPGGAVFRFTLPLAAPHPT